MKFSAIGAFEKHLKQAFPDHLAPVFLVVAPCDYERRQIMDKIVALLRQKDGAVQPLRLSGLEAPIDRVKGEILTPNLWGGLTVVIYDAVDKVKNNAELGALPFSPGVHLILGASGFKPVSELYQKGKKEIVVLDMSDEKPWERQRRLQEWIFEVVKREKKQISSDVVHDLLEHLGTDLAVLDQELAKLLCYVGDRPKIEREDTLAICGSRDLVTGWQLAEKIVWDRPAFLGEKASDLAFIFPFIGQVRYHLQLGYRMTELLDKKGDLKTHFPTLRPQQLEKFTPLAKARSSRFFQRGLQALYQFELAAKSSPIDLATSLDVFQAHLYEPA